MIITRRTAMRAATLVVTAALLAACTSGSNADGPIASPTSTVATNELAGKSPSEMLLTSIAAAQKQKSVRMVLEDENAKVFQRSYTEVALVNGQGAVGWVQIGPGKMAFISMPGKAWWQADEEFWKSQGVPKNFARFKDRWIEVTPKTLGFSDLINYGTYDTAIKNLLTVDQLLQRGPISTVAGVRSVTMTAGQDGALAIAADGTPLPVRYSTQSARADFSDWNASNLQVKAPDAKLIVPFAKVPQIN